MEKAWSASRPISTCFQFSLEIGDRLGPVTVHVDERGYNKNKYEQEHRGYSNQD